MIAEVQQDPISKLHPTEGEPLPIRKLLMKPLHNIREDNSNNSRTTRLMGMDSNQVSVFSRTEEAMEDQLVVVVPVDKAETHLIREEDDRIKLVIDRYFSFVNCTLNI